MNMNEIALGILLLCSPMSLPTPVRQIRVMNFCQPVPLAAVDAAWERAGELIRNDPILKLFWSFLPDAMPFFTTVMVAPVFYSGDRACLREVRWSTVYTNQSKVFFTIIVSPRTVEDGTFQEALETGFEREFAILEGKSGPFGYFFPGCAR